ncbi:MAG: hypothetical protein GEV10_09520 [Streptosporangiales bacterium]|nr:hypothetical protein [Streptosporangiales bacterium]
MARPRIRRAMLAPLASMLAGVFLIAALIEGPTLYGMVTAGSKLSPQLANVSGPTGIEVNLSFPAQTFHVRQLSEYGVFGGTPSDDKVILVNVSPANVRALSYVYWISSIEPM